jgi:drug/metabolite transporter (DMT)-like permease
MPFFFVTGLFGFTIYVITFNIGAQSVSVATSSIIISTTPIITVLIASFLYRERLSIYQWIAVLLEFTGVIIICLWDNMFSFNGGMLWIIAAAFSFSIYNILQRKLTTKYSPLQSTSYSMLTASVLLMFFLPQSVPELEYSTIEAVISVLVMGILCSVLAYILWSKALSLAPKTSDVTNYLFLSPFLSAILGFVFLKEIPNLGTWIGGSIVLFGMLLFERKQN